MAGGGQIAWAIEGTRHYGLGLARYLASAGQQVAEIDSTRHVGKRRAGKSDPIDAVRAARELLARPHPAQMRADGDREALRLLMIDRDHAVASCKSARTALAAVLVTAPAPLREQLRHLPRERRARACAALDCPPGADRQTRVLHQTLARLGQRIADLAGTAAGIEAQITQIARGHDPRPGRRRTRTRRPVRRADPAVLVPRRPHPQRSSIRHDAGTAPVPVSSGRTDRHRLNRLGDRQLNRALNVIAVNRMRCHPATQSYVQRRRAEGRTDREIRRCIKRYIARHLYRTLTSGGNSTPPNNLTNIGAS
jgi:transposase